MQPFQQCLHHLHPLLPTRREEERLRCKRSRARIEEERLRGKRSRGGLRVGNLRQMVLVHELSFLRIERLEVSET